MQYTETNRWDALLAVAEAFSALDRRGMEDTSEEEAEEEFLDHDEQPKSVLSLRATNVRLTLSQRFVS